LRHGAARDRGWLRVWIAKQSCEDVRLAKAASVRAPAIQRIVGHGEELPTRDILFALDGNVGQFALGPFHYRKQRLVMTVDILAEFELATVIYESRLVGHVNRQ